MKSLSVKLGVILVGLLIFGYTEVWGADWKLYGQDDECFTYYDAQSITRLSKNIVRVWIRINYTEKGVMAYVGQFGKKYENLRYLMMLSEIDCAEKKIRVLSTTNFDNKAGVICSDSDTPPKWEFIPPETAGEFLCKEVCK